MLLKKVEDEKGYQSLNVPTELEELSTNDWLIQESIKDQPQNWLTEYQPANFGVYDNFSKVRRIYTIENIFEIRKFLRKHPNLIDVLLDAHPEIRKYFPSEKLQLKVYVDPESPQWETLVLSIFTSPEFVDEALNKLDEFDEKWWIEASLGVAVNLSINLEFE